MKKRVGAVEAMRWRKLILIAYGLLTPLSYLQNSAIERDLAAL